MRVLVACEFSGIVRDAFAARGHDAWSCDLLPTERPGNHIQGDVFNYLNENWDLLIFHWACTYLCNSGVRWLHEKSGRWNLMRESAEKFKMVLDSGIPKIAGENPRPHKYALKIIGQKYNQVIQPWQFGHGETKATCLWLVGLPPLMSTSIVTGREQRVFREPPSGERWKNRSRTLPGIAKAMAEQWG